MRAAPPRQKASNDKVKVEKKETFMRFDATAAIRARFLLAGLFVTSLGCTETVLPAVMSGPGTGGAAAMGLGGQPIVGTGGTPGTGGTSGTGGAPGSGGTGTGGGMIFTTDPTDRWQTFGTVNQ